MDGILVFSSVDGDDIWFNQSAHRIHDCLLNCLPGNKVLGKIIYLIKDIKDPCIYLFQEFEWNILAEVSYDFTIVLIRCINQLNVGSLHI